MDLFVFQLILLHSLNIIPKYVNFCPPRTYVIPSEWPMDIGKMAKKIPKTVYRNNLVKISESQMDSKFNKTKRLFCFGTCRKIYQ